MNNEPTEKKPYDNNKGHTSAKRRGRPKGSVNKNSKGADNGSPGNQKKQRYWSRRPVAEQLMKKGIPLGGGITVYFISNGTKTKF